MKKMTQTVSYCNDIKFLVICLCINSGYIIKVVLGIDRIMIVTVPERDIYCILEK